jgi:aldose sugar dehydrogenase
MRAKALLGGLVLVALGAIPGWGATLAAPATGPDGIGAEPVATGLEYPAGFTFAPDGRIFYAELLTGEIRIFEPSTGSDTLFYTVSGAEQGQMGLISLAVHPRYPTTPYIYAYASRFVQGAQRNQILRIVDDGGVGTNARVIYSVLMLGVEHFGAHMVFGRDRMLYVVTGEQGDPANAQDLDNTLGKVLRMTDRGRVPPDNPFPDSLVWAFGIRNSIGLAFDPLTGNLWEEDNGPECNDEINRIELALNYGWGPAGTCDIPPDPPANTNQDGPDPVLPVRWFATPRAPTGVSFCRGCGLPGSEGALFVGNFNTMDILRAVLTADREDILSLAKAYQHSSPVHSVERGPDGGLYFSDLDAIWRLVNE